MSQISNEQSLLSSKEVTDNGTERGVFFGIKKEIGKEHRLLRHFEN